MQNLSSLKYSPLGCPILPSKKSFWVIDKVIAYGSIYHFIACNDDKKTPN